MILVINAVLFVIYRTIFISIIDFPKELLFSVFGLLNLFLLRVSFGSIETKSHYTKAAKYGSHGSSEWLSKKDIKKEYQTQNFGFVFGSTQKNDSNRNSAMYTNFKNPGGNGQVIVLGPPGSYKTTSFVLPNVTHITDLKEKPDLIITDTKGEIKSLKEEELKEKGYDVYTLDFVNFTKQDSINIFDYITEEQDILEIASTLKQVLFKSDSGKNGKFWEDSFLNIIIAVISIFHHKRMKGEIESFSFSDVIEHIDFGFIIKHEQYFREMGGIALNSFNFIKSIDEVAETKGNVLATMRTSLSIFALKKLENAIGGTTCDIRKLGRDIRVVPGHQEHIKAINNLEEEINYWNRNKKEILSKLFQVYLDEVRRVLNKNHEDVSLAKVNIEILSDEEKLNRFLNDQYLMDKTIEEINRKEGLYLRKKQEAAEHFQKKLDGLQEKRKRSQETIHTHKSKPMAIFMLIKDNDDTYAAAINLIISTMMRTMYKTARELTDGVALEKPVVGILEEFCNIGKLDVLIQSLSTMRARQIYFSMIIQTVPQLQRVYGNDFDEIFSMCDYKLILGCADVKTAKIITENLGQTTIKTQSVSQKDEIDLLNDKKTISDQYAGRKLLFESELLGFDKEQGIIIKKGLVNPAKFYKVVEKYWEKKK